MDLIERYQDAISNVVKKVRETQRENFLKAGEIVAKAAESGKKIYLGRIVHQIEHDLIYRGGGPIFYKEYKKDECELHEGDVLFVSSVSGRSKDIVDLAWDSMKKGVHVIALTSMSYAAAVDPVHESGKKLHEMVSVALDNCAPPAEAMLKVDGIEAPFAACSGIASSYIMWSITAAAVEKMLADGYTPGILKSANFPGGNDYNKTIIEPNYEKNGY